MRKWILASVAAVALVGAAPLATAASGDPAGQPGGPEMGQHMPSPEIMKVMLDAKLGGMKAALKLTADQEKLWTPFEAAVRDADRMREDAMREMRDRFQKGERPTPIERINLMADHMAKGATELKQVADAAKPLYDSLNDTQKRDFGPLLQTLRPNPGPHEGHGPWSDHEGGEMPH